MARTIDSAKRVISGTYGEVWIDGEKIAECTACRAVVAKNKETINLCGQFMTDTKATSGSGTGSLTLYKVDRLCPAAGRHPGRGGSPGHHHLQAAGPGQLRRGAGGHLQREL